MYRLRQAFIFALICAALMTIMAMPAAANADSMTVSAKSAVVIDRATGEVLFEKNAHEKLPMASTTKIMTALIALESGSLDEEFTVDSDAIKVEGSSMGLREGDRVTMRSLVCGMLLPSGNDAANAAAVKIAGSTDGFVALMNEKAKQLGLSSTHFVTPSGLDDYTDEHYSTAYDMARLADKALENKDFAEICSQKYIKLTFGNPPQERWLTNSNKLLDSCEGVVGVKTGFTDKARRCLVSACERDGARLICVTLNAPDDWADHSALYDYCFKMMRTIKLDGTAKEFDIPLAGGKSVRACSEGVSMSLPKGSERSIRCEVRIRPFAFAPIKKGEIVGSVSCYYGSRLLCRRDIMIE